MVWLAFSVLAAVLYVCLESARYRNMAVVLRSRLPRAT